MKSKSRKQPRQRYGRQPNDVIVNGDGDGAGNDDNVSDDGGVELVFWQLISVDSKAGFMRWFRGISFNLLLSPDNADFVKATASDDDDDDDDDDDGNNNDDNNDGDDDGIISGKIFVAVFITSRKLRWKKTVSHDVLNFNHITISKLGLIIGTPYHHP
uniref:Uncharacterized protein n=1 Tax=Glossina austeni TaxID=7395 RepID=A0A1A9VUZ6_GLOAU